MATVLFNTIQSLLNDRNMSVSELERKADLGNGTIRRWSESMPSIDKVAKVASVFNVSLEYLYNGDNSINSKSRVLARSFEKLSENEIDSVNALIQHYINKKGEK